DILLYDTEVVPVGEDQRQHIEYTREAAGKFNRTFGETFTIPEERILSGVGTIPGTDGQKMSKSYKNTIPLFGSKNEVEKAVMSIVTDSGGERPENVFAIHALFRTETELEKLYAENAGQYKNLKEILVSDIEEVIAPMRSDRDDITDEDVYAVLKNGAEVAQERAHKKMQDVRDKIGILN
ncbi:MAG: tryptophan--tRNA ligase, partial [Candidatus Paceibacterota bacterium]